MTRKIIIDSDPGQDDAVAILLAFASPELEVLGITAVAGNVPLPLTEVNSRKLCELAGRTDVPVHAGALGPLERELITAEYVHGDTGIDGCDLPEPTMPLGEGHAADFIVEQVMASVPGSITLCPLGPLTNIAMAMQREPAIAARVAGIHLMGGGFFEGGNTTPAAEFNILVDPEAAAVVFGSGAEIVVYPLDVTHKVLILPEHIDRLEALGTPVGDAVAGMLVFYERFDLEKYGMEGGPLHDPCVIAGLIDPTLFTGRHVNVEIETESPLTLGMTVVDWWGTTDREPNATVMRFVDSPRFFDLLIERLATL